MCFYIVLYNIFYKNYIMFEFLFRKKSTILLLLSVIFISLVFSILLNVPLREGLENEETINNPPPNIIIKISDKLKDNKLSNIEKLIAIKTDPDINLKKYKILSDICKKNESAILKELKDYLDKPPKINSEGNPVDENALRGDKRTDANNIISSNDYSAIEKIEKIKKMGDKDNMVNIILTEYITSWFKMIKDNVEKLQGITDNTTIAKPSATPSAPLEASPPAVDAVPTPAA